MVPQAACDQSKCAALAMASEVESTVAIAPTEHQVSMVDLWQPTKDNTAQQATVGWERKLESAGDIPFLQRLCDLFSLKPLYAHPSTISACRLHDQASLIKANVSSCAGNVQTWHRSESGPEKSPLSHTAQEGQQSMSAGGKGQPIGESRSCAVIVACLISSELTSYVVWPYHLWQLLIWKLFADRTHSICIPEVSLHFMQLAPLFPGGCQPLQVSDIADFLSVDHLIRDLLRHVHLRCRCLCRVKSERCPAPNAG